MTWYHTVGKAAAGTASVVGIITAAPIFGAIGTITATGLAVSTIIGTSAALIDDALEDERTNTPKVPAPQHPLITYEHHNKKR